MTSEYSSEAVRTSADLESLRGWLPVDAEVLDGRPGLKWMDMDGVELSEPFFQQTVERLSGERQKRGQRFTEFDVLLQLEKTFDSVAPSGFIFHSSRCGSTLVANACRALADSIVISEAFAIDKLLARFITDAAGDGIKQSVYSVFLRGVVNSLAQRRKGSERHLFVKFSCCSVFHLERIRRIWPNVPWLFLYRDPAETIVSNLMNVPEWMLDKDHRILAAIVGTSPAAISEMSREELCARAIGSFYSTACKFADAGGMLLNYNQISEPVLIRVFQFFGVPPSRKELGMIANTNRIYSKDPAQSSTFVADTVAKQTRISSLVREMVVKWSAEPYRLLEQKRAEMDRVNGVSVRN